MSRGTIVLLATMIMGLRQKGQQEYTPQLMHRRTMLLTNGGNAPIPNKILNQRQKRKRNRQTQNFG